MKKGLKPLAGLLCFLVLTGCGAPAEIPPAPTDVPPPAETSSGEAVPFREDQLYAVACLGYEKEENLARYTRYLDGDELPTHHVSGGEYYLVIPRYSDMTVRLYKNSFETSEGTLFYESTQSGPFVIRCNVSDIFPDVTVEFVYGEESAAFSPYISLKDGSVVVGERGLDLASDQI